MIYANVSALLIGSIHGQNTMYFPNRGDQSTNICTQKLQQSESTYDKDTTWISNKPK